MKPRLLLSVTRAASKLPCAEQLQHPSRSSRVRVAIDRPCISNAVRPFSTSHQLFADATVGSSQSLPAEQLNHNVTDEEKLHYERAAAHDREKQIRTPWHREGSDKPPVARERSAGAMTKGKLLTTPSRMLKLILPLTTHDSNTDRNDAEPLALLVHPQQPLSYLARLIQSELPTIKDKDGKERIPNVYFRAEDSMQDNLESARPTPVEDEAKTEEIIEEEEEKRADSAKEDELDPASADSLKIDGKTTHTGKLNRRSQAEAAALRGGHGEGGVESYSGLGHEARTDGTAARKFVRWSSSTEIGDFIRDAARGQEFAVEIEGAPREIRVGVPSFNDRTYYLRMRLRNKSKEIAKMADVKRECDALAHKGAQRVAIGGFGVLVGWWYLVYRLTFETELGWDVMEPVTYLVGLSTLIGGYVWFLYHNREVSYRSAMNITISRRQSKLYDQKGFDVRKWESLIEEGNALRREIKAIASEYDVEWDEKEDEREDKVIKALRKDRERKKGKKGRKKGEGDEEEAD